MTQKTMETHSPGPEGGRFQVGLMLPGARLPAGLLSAGLAEVSPQGTEALGQ